MNDLQKEDLVKKLKVIWLLQENLNSCNKNILQDYNEVIIPFASQAMSTQDKFRNPKLREAMNYINKALPLLREVSSSLYEEIKIEGIEIK